MRAGVVWAWGQQRAQVRESGNVRDEAERCLGGVAVFAEVHVNRNDIGQIREEVDLLSLRDGPHTQGHSPRTRPSANSLAKGLEQFRIDKEQDKPPKDDDILTGIIAGSMPSSLNTGMLLSCVSENSRMVGGDGEEGGG